MDNHRKKIMIVISNLSIGGKEKTAINLANGLDPEKHEPWLVCLGGVQPKTEALVGKKTKLVVLNKKPGNNISTIIQLAHLMRRERIHIVHSNNWGTMLESLIAAKWAGIHKIIHTQHGLDYGHGENRMVRGRLRIWIKRFSCKGIACIVAVSKEIRDVVIREWRAHDEQVKVILNGIEVEEVENTIEMRHQKRVSQRSENGYRETDLIIGSVGLLRAVKDYQTLIRSMKIVNTEIPYAKLVLVGDGPERDDLRKLVKELSLEGCVRFLGYRDDVEHLLQMMDIFVLNSISEGTSIAILEAMAAGLPVVATSTGGTPDIVEDRGTGLLVPPRDFSGTSAAILTLIRNPQMRKSMGARGRKRVRECFSVERMIRNYESLYEDISQ